jgi:nanoRNase/pAp phosphatase (c-di-AMP/oligoRNAs hydrolase)
MPKQIEPEERLARLVAVLEGARTVLIVMQNNPDPDAIAAAAGLRQIANGLTGAACSLAHGGTIGRAENEALVRYLGINTRPLTTLDLDRFDRIAMVDAQPGAGNVSLDAEVRLDVVIDHHPIRRETRKARFTDIRQRYGATSTILFEYLRASNIEVDAPLATALVYGIRSDTQDLGRESTRADIEAFLSLYPSANPRALGRIVAAPLPRAYFGRLRTVLDNATVYGSRIISCLEGLDTPDMIGESADLLLRVNGVTWTLCYGTIDGWLHLSLRTVDRERNAGAVARRLAGRRGFGGGHQTLAAAQIPLQPKELVQKGLRRFTGHLIKRFLAATGPADEPGQPLCQ